MGDLMGSEFPAGLSRSHIEFTLKNDDEVLSVRRIDGDEALWLISYSFEGQQPVEMLIDNGGSGIYVQVLVQIDADHIVEALTALAPFAVVGLTIMNDLLFMRSGFFIEHSTMHAFTNSYRATACAYLRYQQTISV